MTTSLSTPRRITLNAWRLMASALLVAGLAACGGGSDQTDNVSDKSFKGTVTSYSSPQSFSVDGVPVDASGSGATPQGMTTGSRVEVHGQMVNGTLQARKVQLDDSDDRDDDNGDPNELEGRVTAYSGPTSFSVDGIPVDASAAPRTLSVGMHVEVYGTMSNGTLVATRVKIEDGDDEDESDDDNCTDSGKSDCHDDDQKDDGHDDDDDGEDDDRCVALGKSDCDKD